MNTVTGNWGHTCARAVLVFAVLAALAIAACGGDGDDTAATTTSTETQATATAETQATATTQETPATEASDTSISGTVEIDGSSTVAPVSEAAAYEFSQIYGDVDVIVGISGTGGGFKRFTVGETDISDASRAIKDSEAEAAVANGIEYYEIPLGTDGLSVMVHPENDFVDCLTIGELKMIWEPGSTIDNWNQVRSTFPDQRIRLYGPDTDSGTFDYFTEEIVGEAQASRHDYTASADDNTLVQGIAGDRSSLGYFGYAYYSENSSKLKLVAVDKGDGCVTPGPETIESGEYAPLSRPLFIYVNKESLERPEVRAFVTYYLENAYELVRQTGYIRLPQSEYQQSLDLISGIGDDSAAMTEGQETSVAATFDTSIDGTVEIDGSSTVAPVSEAAAYEFSQIYGDVDVIVGISGTGGGFKRFTVGETDISDASRAIKDSEAEAAVANGIEYYEIPLGTDGLSVMVHPENDFVDCLTIGELKMIWEPGSTIDNWNQVRSTFPDQRIRLYGPDTDSGTFDYFTEEIVGEAQASRHDYTASADDNTLVQGIAGDRSSLGYFGYAYYSENSSKLKLVAVDKGDGCVTPGPETIESGEYAPLSRPLFIYVNKESLERPEVRAFVTFYLENAYELVRQTGYIRLPQSDYQQSLDLISQ